MNKELQRHIDEVEAPYKNLCDQEWVVGENDRGMGHCSYAVITARFGAIVVKCDHLIIAEHIVKTHNEREK